MEDIIARFEYLISATEGNPTAFSKRIGVAQTTLSNQLRGPKGISLEVIGLALNSFPEISAEWLIRGKGEMYSSDNLPPMTGEEDDKTLDLHAQLAKLTAEVGELRLQNIKLQAQMEYLEEYNTRLILKLK